MLPIVHGLEDEYGDQVAFRFLVANDGGEGETVFGALAIPGHPGFVLFNAAGVETYRAFGIVPRAALAAELDAALSLPPEH